MTQVAPEFIKVTTLTDLVKQNGSVKILVNGKGVAIFQRGGKVFAVQNACPHRGAPLVGGQITHMTDGLFVICSDHAWRFRLTDGICPEAGPECTLLTWDVKVEGDDVYVSRFPRLQE